MGDLRESNKLLYDKNRVALAEFMEQVKFKSCMFSTLGTKCDALTRDGQLKYNLDIDGDAMVVYFEDKSGRPVYFDVTNGLYLELTEGNHLVEWISSKSNNRRYVSLDLGSKRVMVVDYWLELALMSKIDPTKYKDAYDTWVYGRDNYRVYTTADKRRLGLKLTDSAEGLVHDTYEINHKDGDTYNCCIDNLEVVRTHENLAHSRLMSEIGYYYPNIVEEVGCNPNKQMMHRYTSGYQVSCKMIQSYNDAHTDTRIAPYKDAGGVFRPRFTIEQINDILSYFGMLDVGRV